MQSSKTLLKENMWLKFRRISVFSKQSTRKKELMREGKRNGNKNEKWLQDERKFNLECEEMTALWAMLHLLKEPVEGWAAGWWIGYCASFQGAHNVIDKTETINQKNDTPEQEKPASWNNCRQEYLFWMGTTNSVQFHQRSAATQTVSHHRGTTGK